MEYLKRVLGIEVLYENKALEHLPNFISTRYDSQKVSLSGQKAVFLYPKTELEQVETLKKHLERVKKVADRPVVLVLEQITARQKEYLLREKIAFIVDGKQIYLPFMAAYLQERCDAEKSDREEILPSAQMLLLYYIYEGAKELSTSQAAKDLDLTPTSISSNQDGRYRCNGHHCDLQVSGLGHPQSAGRGSGHQCGALPPGYLPGYCAGCRLSEGRAGRR